MMTVRERWAALLTIKAKEHELEYFRLLYRLANAPPDPGKLERFLMWLCPALFP